MMLLAPVGELLRFTQAAHAVVLPRQVVRLRASFGFGDAASRHWSRSSQSADMEMSRRIQAVSAVRVLRMKNGRFQGLLPPPL